MNEVVNVANALVCGEPCEVYCRVCGYYRPVEDMNCGKQEEFHDRQNFNFDKN